jgi:hypothetical protein
MGRASDSSCRQKGERTSGQSRYSIYLLYWQDESTNTDAAAAGVLDLYVKSVPKWSVPDDVIFVDALPVLSLLAFLVQAYKY